LRGYTIDPASAAHSAPAARAAAPAPLQAIGSQDPDSRRAHAQAACAAAAAPEGAAPRGAQAVLQVGPAWRGLPASQTASSSGAGMRGWALWQQDPAVCGRPRAGQARRGLPAPGAAGGAAGQARGLASVQPEHTVYTGPQAGPARRVTLRTVRAKHARGEPLTMVTAYDYPSAVHVPPQAAPAPPCLPRCLGTTCVGGTRGGQAWTIARDPALSGPARHRSGCRLVVHGRASGRAAAGARPAGGCLMGCPHMHARAGETLTCTHKLRSAPGSNQLQL